MTGDRFQVKRLVVNPGAAPSLQSLHHRAEPWMVVKGTGRTTVDQEVRLETENQSVYVRVGAVHRLESPGRLQMIPIEVQTGSDLGADDIIRCPDLYARTRAAEPGGTRDPFGPMQSGGKLGLSITISGLRRICVVTAQLRCDSNDMVNDAVAWRPYRQKEDGMKTGEICITQPVNTALPMGCGRLLR